MRKLHLVGLTTDRDGLIFTARKGSKSGGFIVPLDDKIVAAIAEAREAVNGAPAEQGVPEVPKRLRSQSALTPREMQARLRAGRSIEEVAAEAGVDTEWVARFAVPILAEQAQVVELARGLVYAKPRLGESAQPLGTSVVQNLVDRGVFLPDDIADAGWSAFQLHDSVWMVRFRYRSRGRDQEAQWEVDVPAGRLVARNRYASDLGYVDPNRRRRDIGLEDETVEVEPAPPPRRSPRRVAKVEPKRTSKRAAPRPAARARTPVPRPAKAAKATKATNATKAGKTTKVARTAKTAKTAAKVAKVAKATPAKSPTRRRPAKAAPAAEAGPTAGSGGVRQAVAHVSAARVAASMATADREPWAAAVRRPAKPAPPPASPPPVATRRSPRRPVRADVDRERRGAGQEEAPVPAFQPRPLPAPGDMPVEARVRRVAVPRTRTATDEMPAVSLPAPRRPAPRQEAKPIERVKRRRLRSR